MTVDGLESIGRVNFELPLEEVLAFGVGAESFKRLIDG